MTIIFFGVSLFILSGMVILKTYEVRLKKNHFISNLFSKGDLMIHQAIEKMIYAYNHYKKIARLFVFDFLPSFAYEMLVRLKDYTAKKYYQWGNDFRGRRMLRDRGSVSTFLQNIAENKSDTSENKI